jgi:hypothetical protein
MATKPEAPDRATDPEVVPVTTSGVRGRPSPRPPEGRSVLIAMTALAAALLVGGLALRTDLRQTAASTPGFDGAGALGATEEATAEPGIPGTATIGPSTAATEATAADIPGASVEPTRKPTLATPTPTKKPPKPTPPLDPGPTDAPHPTWTPAAVFTGTATMYDRCFASNGKEQVMVKGEWKSPVPITAVEFYLDGRFFGSLGAGIGGSYEAWAATGDEVEVGTTHVGKVEFYSGPSGADLVATRESDAFVAPQGSPCP